MASKPLTKNLSNTIPLKRIILMNIDITDNIMTHALALAEMAISRCAQVTQRAVHSAIKAGDLSLCMAMDPEKESQRALELKAKF